MAEDTGLLFDNRFMDRHAGSIISDPAVAIVELVANSWDAWATRVDIVWPEPGSDTAFAILDNGKGMTEAQFQRRWKTLDYNRVREEGPKSVPPAELGALQPRATYGRNGKGRHAAFRFGDSYTVRTWRDGNAVTFAVRRSVTQPFVVERLKTEEEIVGHGTEITAINPQRTHMSPDEVREVVGTRFLADPNFEVTVNGTKVTFDDIPKAQRRTVDIEVPGFGIAHMIVIDTQKADKTTRQHGIAWRVNNRLVGSPGWIGFDQERLVDGRSSEARRFIFIIGADFLADEVLPDWSGFSPNRKAWPAKRERWTRALTLLESDRLFKRAEVWRLIEEYQQLLASLDSRGAGRELRKQAREIYGKLSSGHKIVLLTVTRVVETLEERSLVLVDEPEAHLHPPLLSAFIRSLSDLLINRNGVAIIATHSPVILQEVPKTCVWRIRRSGREMRIERPTKETFGENVGTLTQEIFGLEVTASGFHKMISDAVDKGLSYEQIVDRFGDQLGDEARGIALALIATRDAEDRF